MFDRSVIQDRESYHCCAIGMDMSDEASVVAACAEILRRHSVPWALVNNAGIQDRQYLLEERVEGWDRIQAVNARGAVLATREIGRAMARAGGRIVNIASATLAGMLVTGVVTYVASRGALAALSGAAALEFAPHAITVNTVLPGAVMTPGAVAAKGPLPEGPGVRPAPLGWCEPRDIGAAVLFRPAARYITNQVLAVDAGWSLS
jgi:NAD(P)-dependent dehydrogenase (short-subunit alcohol dehydrogenase family)